MVSWIWVNLSDTLLAMYVPVVVRESAPRITPSLNLTAMMDVPNETSPFFKWLMSTEIPFMLAEESLSPLWFSSAGHVQNPGHPMDKRLGNVIYSFVRNSFFF